MSSLNPNCPFGLGKGNRPRASSSYPPVLHRKQSDSKKEPEKKKEVHIKKPLNAFMLYMKEMRAKVVAECTLKESAAINQILGRRVRYEQDLGSEGAARPIEALNRLI